MKEYKTKLFVNYLINASDLTVSKRLDSSSYFLCTENYFKHLERSDEVINKSYSFLIVKAAEIKE